MSVKSHKKYENAIAIYLKNANKTNLPFTIWVKEMLSYKESFFIKATQHKKVKETIMKIVSQCHLQAEGSSKVAE